MHWLLAFAGVAAAIRNDAILGYVPPPPPEEAITLNVDGISRRAPAAASPIQARTFQQLIDHKDPSKGTFSQRYWYNAEFYKGPGSPIVLNAPGEYAADGFTGYTTNRTLPGVFAQTSGGATIILEHRYWGQSSPYDTLTSETLQYLTLDQAIADVVNFAKNVQLDFDPDRSSAPDKAPWVLSGCSYPGALSAWIHDLAPGTFWAYHCSSAPVETIADFWEYYTPVEMAMPRNCSKDYRSVMKYVDRVLANGTDERIQKLKTAFGFGDLKHNDDFASAITGGLGQWQSQQFYSGYTGFYKMCDYIEGQWPGSNTTIPGEEGVGTCKAVKNFAKWWREVELPGPGKCADNTTSCYDTYDLKNPAYTDISTDDAYGRAWMWMLCNEPFEYWQAHGPNGMTPKLFDYKYYRRQCPLYFPEVNGHTFGLNKGLTADDVDKRTGGWDNAGNSTRLMWVNGEFDPWRSGSVMSDYRPQGKLVSTDAVPSFLLPKAAHCNDMIIKNAESNPGVQAVVQAEIAKMKEWVDDFYKKKNATRT